MLIRAMYRQVASVVRTDTDEAWFETETGLKQGSVLSPMLFNLLIDELIEHLNQTGLGVKLGDRKLACLLFADDVLLIADSAEELQQLLDVAAQFAEKWLMRFSASKSAVLVFGSDRSDCLQQEWKLGADLIKRTDKYVYLGVTLTDSGEWRAQAAKLAGAARSAAEKLSVAGIVGPWSKMRTNKMFLQAFVRSTVQFASAAIPLFVRGRRDEAKLLENAQNFAARAVSGVQSAKGAALELAMPSVRACHALQMFGFFQHVMQAPRDSIVRCAMTVAQNSANTPVESSKWAVQLNSLTSQYRVTLEGAEEKSWLAQVKKTVLDADLREQTQQAREAGSLAARAATETLEDTGSLPSLLDFTELESIAAEKRQLLLALRSGGALLMPALQARGVLQSGRCLCCQTGATETDEHLLIHCSAFIDLRRVLRQRLARRLHELGQEGQTEISAWNELDEEQWLRRLLLLHVVARDCTRAEVESADVVSSWIAELWSKRAELCEKACTGISDFLL